MNDNPIESLDKMIVEIEREKQTWDAFVRLQKEHLDFAQEKYDSAVRNRDRWAESLRNVRARRAEG